MAAGLTLSRKQYDAFVKALTTYAKLHITPDQLVPTIKPDVLADLHEITHQTAIAIERMGPFGIGNRAPIVQVMAAPVDEVKSMGAKGKHLSLRVGNARGRVRCLWWGHGDLCQKLHRGMVIDLVGKIKINEFRGNCTAELDLLDIALPSS